ncbi:MAG: exodeoxyribonuclease VII large subunit, partial [Lachnospiraceae bacterium]|nr:exodeoxyribonuclease VII large subunit [Lachnospiraceae bacterium]
MKTIYTVFQVNTYIHNMFREDYLLSDVSVTGEISNLKFHSSGHIYFTLKDAQSAISCAIFRSSAQKLNIALKDGDKIVAHGSISNYVPSGSVTFNITSVEYEGVGDLTKRFEELKKKLSEQGLFDKEFKKPIPAFPKTIGIVTAPTGAAIRDIISVSKRRNPYISLVLYPALVQGDGAAATIVNGIEVLEKMGVDVIIVGRGGGSLEDLWAFNEEEVAYAIFQCSVPIISAVGHEIDFTISDFTADYRAATPSAAAEIAVPDIKGVIDDIDALSKNLDKSMSR